MASTPVSPSCKWLIVRRLPVCGDWHGAAALLLRVGPSHRPPTTGTTPSPVAVRLRRTLRGGREGKAHSRSRPGWRCFWFAADQSRTIRTPLHMVTTMARVRDVLQRLLQELEREPTFEETAQVSGISLVETQLALAAMCHPMSLDRPVGTVGDCLFGDLLPDSEAQSPSVAASEEMLRQQISTVLQTLNCREREVLRLRYGLDDGHCYTLEEVGHVFQVTRERIRQIEAKAFRKLRYPCRSRELAEFLD